MIGLENAVNIIPMERAHAQAAAELVVQQLGLTPDELVQFGQESPEACFSEYLRKSTPEGARENIQWAQETLNDPTHLYYYVALNKANDVLGVVGLYQALSGYSDKIGARALDSQPAEAFKNKLENNKTFWIGWFGVKGDAQRKGVGTALLRESVRHAVHTVRGLGRQDDLRAYNYAVYADHGAIRYYERLGFHIEALVRDDERHIDHAVMSVPLKDLAANLQLPIKDHGTKQLSSHPLSK